MLDSSSSSDCGSCDSKGGGDANRYDKFPKHQRRAMRENKNKENENENEWKTN